MLDTRPRHIVTGSTCLLLVLAVLLLGTATVARWHVHDLDSPGLYSTDCPLQDLAATDTSAVAPAPPSIWTGLVLAGAVEFDVPAVSTTAVVAASSRAPPLA
jgi:hypothetical protein